MSEDYFSENYQHARGRFLAAAEQAGAEIKSYAVDAEAGLYIDVAIVDPVQSATNRNAVMVTSGVHGIEGFFGSAVQLALLESMSDVKPELRTILVHAINPFGFRYMRRFNEDNIDLNRNFPGPQNSYVGAPDGYTLHNCFLNPDSRPSRAELFKLKAIWKIWRHGMSALKESIATGQYEYPQGLFYGGRAPAESTRIVVDNLPLWVGQSSQVIHIDLHTGLGRYGQFKLLVNERADTEHYHWYESRFDKSVVESLNDSGGTAYPVCGVFGEWAQRQYGLDNYRLVGAEFGTYDVVRVIAALRAENRAYHYCQADTASFNKAKHELLECFCPADPVWRRQVVKSALSIISKAAAGL